MQWRNQFKPLPLTSSDSLPSLAITLLEQTGAIIMFGADKKSYLHGQVTCDVVSLAADESTLGAHCDAKGKVWSIFRLFNHNDSYAMLQDKSALETEMSELKKYAVFSKVTIEASNDVILGIVGKDANSWIDSLSEQRGNVRPVAGGSAVRIDDQRWILMLPESQVELIVANSSAILSDYQLWDKCDIANAQPRVTKSCQNEHIPQALNLQALGGICFTKGCYTGQETVARAKYRGINKRAMYPVSGNTLTPLTPETAVELERQVGDNWRSVGNLICHYQYSDNQATGLIVLPNNLEADTKLRLKDQPESQWQINPLPYSLDDE